MRPSFVTEQVATCVLCKRPVKRNQPRQLIGGVQVGGVEGLEVINQDLVHLECAARRES